MLVLQTGQETDFVLVSCTGLGVVPSRREQVLKAKRVSGFSAFVPLNGVKSSFYFFLFLCYVLLMFLNFL